MLGVSKFCGGFSSGISSRINSRVSRRFCALGRLSHSEARKLVKFTCNLCNGSVEKTMSKLAYEKGVVIMKCDSCQSMHLIADHLGWYDSQAPPGKITDFMNASRKK